MASTDQSVLKLIVSEFAVRPMDKPRILAAVRDAVHHFKDSKKIVAGLKDLKASAGIVIMVEKILKHILDAAQKRRKEQEKKQKQESSRKVSNKKDSSQQEAKTASITPARPGRSYPRPRPVKKPDTVNTISTTCAASDEPSSISVAASVSCTNKRPELLLVSQPEPLPAVQSSRTTPDIGSQPYTTDEEKRIPLEELSNDIDSEPVDNIPGVQDIQGPSSANGSDSILPATAAIKAVPDHQPSLNEILTAAANAARAGVTPELVQVNVSQWLRLIERLRDVNNIDARALEELLKVLINAT